MPTPRRIPPGPGQESVWDYPRPPRLAPANHPLRVEFAGQIIAATSRALRVLETSHPPTYYFPPGDVRHEFLRQSARESWCEWKGRARYFDIVVNDRHAASAAWSYPHPTHEFLALANYLAFFPHALDACYVANERATAQPGGFYGGWVTSHIVGPFKGAPGTSGW